MTRSRSRGAGRGRGRGRGQAQPDTNSDDVDYTPPAEPRGSAPSNVRRQGSRGGRVTSQTLTTGEHIDIALSDEGSSQEDDIPPVPPAPLNAAVPTTSNTVGALVAQPAPVPAPSSHGHGSRGNVAHDINHFFRRGKKSQEGSSTVCKKCEKEHADDRASWPGHNYTFSPYTGNASLRVHLENFHKAEYLQICSEQQWSNQLPKSRREETTAGSIGQSTQDGHPRPTFSRQTFLNHLVNFVVADDQSINVVECREFRNLLLLLREDLQDKDIPHRTKLREAIIKAWRAWFKTLKAELACAAGRISFTADIWSDHNRRPYLCITAHWIAKDETTGNLQLKSALIAFHRLRGAHDGKSMAATAICLLDRADITANGGHWTLDNAANNGTFMVELDVLLKARDITFDAEDRRIMCFPHIVNICCQHTIKKFTDVALADASEPTPVAYPPSGNQSFEDAVRRDPVALGRNIVRTLRSSGQRRDAFDDLIKDGNTKGWFQSGDPPESVTLRPLQLLRDVKTRWDSVYFMIKRLRYLRPAIDHFLALPVNRELANYRLTDREWSVLTDFEVVLEIPHQVQQIMSAEYTPILAGAIPCFEMFMSAWERLGMLHPQLAPWIDTGMEYAIRYYGRMDRTRSYIIAMFLNPTVRMNWIRTHWEPEYINEAERVIKNTMAEYRAQRAEGADVPSATVPHPVSNQVPLIQSLAERYGLGADMNFTGPQNPHDQTIEQEYQSYVTAPLSADGTNTLKFWESSQQTYPTIFDVSLDYLPIQASAVPSERAFSSSAETDTKKRNRINPVLMEALQMLKFALKKARLDFTTGWITPESDMREREPEDDLLAALLGDEGEDSMDRLIRNLGEDDPDGEDDEDDNLVL